MAGTVKFNFCGVPVEVDDAKQAERIAELVKGKSYSAARLDLEAPGLMAALRTEMKTCTDVKARPDKFTVKSGKVKAEMSPDRRRVKDGTQIGNR